MQNLERVSVRVAHNQPAQNLSPCLVRIVNTDEAGGAGWYDVQLQDGSVDNPEDDTLHEPFDAYWADDAYTPVTDAVFWCEKIHPMEEWHLSPRRCADVEANNS